MNQISDIDTLYSYADGDVITPGMGVSIAAGHSLAQFFDPTKVAKDGSVGMVTEDSDFSVAANQPTLYPMPYSSKQGTYVVPSSVGQQWYYNNLQVDSAGILDSNGNVKSTFSKLFQKTTYTLNGKTLPALKIIDNLCSADDQTNKTIYYVGNVNGIQVVCKQDIPVNVTTGTPFNVVITCTNNEKQNDTVIDSKTETLTLVAQLNSANAPVGGGTYRWEKLVNGSWINIVTISGEYTVSSDGKQLVLMEGGVSGIENFRCVVTYNRASYYKVITISDVQDVRFVDKGRSTPSNCIRFSEAVTYTPKVYVRSAGGPILEEGWTFAYATSKPDGTILENKTGATYTVQGSTVAEHGALSIAITASKA